MKNKENYLERRPVRPDNLEWTVGEDELVTIQIENKGFFNRVAQKILKKPKISYIHLDETGSLIWKYIDGKRNILEITNFVNNSFGDEFDPSYQRTAKYFQILESYGFIQWNEQ